MATTKKKQPAKAKVRKPRQLPIILDSKAQDQLDVVHKVAGEKTAAKAIVWALNNSTYYKELYEKEKDTKEQLEYELKENRETVAGYLLSLKSLGDLIKSKPGSKRPVLVNCGDCNKKVPEKELDHYGYCRDCSME